MKKSLILTVLALVCMSCLFGYVSVDILKLKDFTTKRPTTIVDFYMSEGRVEKPYFEIAIITVNADEGDRESELVQTAIEKARTLGSDGIIQLDRQFNNDERLIMRFTAIVYK